MDLMSGLAALSSAISIAKDLREIGRTYDEATFKLRMSELQIALADAKVALSDAKIGMAGQQDKIDELRRLLDVAENGEACPKCRNGRMKLKKSSPMSWGGLGRYGVEEWNFECDSESCDFRTTKVHDPQGLVPKFVAKK
jgi:hypothetical protein